MTFLSELKPITCPRLILRVNQRVISFLPLRTTASTLRTKQFWRGKTRLLGRYLSRKIVPVAIAINTREPKTLNLNKKSLAMAEKSNLVLMTNDRRETLMVPDSGLEKIAGLWPKTISELKKTIKENGVQTAIDLIKNFRMTPEDKQSILFIASGFRLTRKFA